MPRDLQSVVDFLSSLQQIQCDDEYRLDPLDACWVAPYLLPKQLSMAGEVNGAHNSATVMAAFWSSLLIVSLTTLGGPGQCRQSGPLIVRLMLLE